MIHLVARRLRPDHRDRVIEWLREVDGRAVMRAAAGGRLASEVVLDLHAGSVRPAGTSSVDD
ncbi:hypothetical protein [Microbacterium arborescens]|uniref:hypothetical protein n=1 Tax=Microbacterium arborescens TaxID=33883 RepID=UPI00278244EA|nr:hypothetical protein [Microbacterium arborescens]MDQ1216659.1 hypothetical protein [Microbacterium arborescens]